MIIDTHAYLSQWPFRRLEGDTPQVFVERMREHQVTQAWVGTFDGLLHKDLGSANARLAEDCRRFGSGTLIPFGSVNPLLPDWAEDVRRCREVHGMRGIRLHPNYHGYTLTHPALRALLELAAKVKLLVQMVVAMEDDRTQHPRLQLSPVDLAPVPAIVSAIPALRLLIHNQSHAAPVKQLAASGRVWFDFAMVERVRGVATLAAQVTPQRVLLGSHFPLFYRESVLLKMRESALSDKDRDAILSGNAAALTQSPAGINAG